MTVSLSNFSGPLELLYHLVQKKELDIYEISLFNISEQFLSYLLEGVLSLDKNAEFLSYSASLAWVKSKALLPQISEEETYEEQWEDPQFEVIHHLVDYCKFKQAARELAKREEKGFQRGGFIEPQIKKPFGIEHLTLSDIALLFQDALSKSSGTRQTIQGEIWKVSDKIVEIKNVLKTNHKIPFHSFFRTDCCKDELIALFLAVLELIKLGIIQVFKEHNTIFIGTA